MAEPDPETRKRLDNFVDAAFGFAVTLLVIAGAQPASLEELQAALGNIPSSAVAFILIVLFWQAHKAFGRLTPVRDGLTTALSLAVVFTALVYVFPLKLLMQALFFWMTGGALPGRELIDSLGDLASLYQIYGLGFAMLSGLYVLLFARSARLATLPETVDAARSWRDAWAICAVSGLLSAGIALFPLNATPWLPPLTYSLIGPAIWLRERLSARRLKPSPQAAEAQA